MPYKVVQTLEKGKAVLTSVPSEWEHDGTLYWPKAKSEKLIKMEDSRPQDSWISQPCILKRRNLRSYEDAQNEINNMMYVMYTISDNESDDEGIQTVTDQHKKTTASTSSSDGHKAINDLAIVITEGDTISKDIKNENSSESVYYLPDQPDPLTSNLAPDKSSQILENQRVIIENQHKIMSKLAECSAQFEQHITKDTLALSQSVPDFVGDFTLIDNLAELDEFERNLKNEYQRNLMYKKYSFVCKGKGNNGFNCAYALIDILFSRKFLTKCSWAGGSRGEESKIPLKAYKNTICLFFNLIRDCDETFTMEDCHVFLKNIMRNATKRHESKGLRTSTSKKRRIKQNILQETGKRSTNESRKLQEIEKERKNKSVNLKQNDALYTESDTDKEVSAESDNESNTSSSKNEANK